MLLFKKVLFALISSLTCYIGNKLPPKGVGGGGATPVSYAPETFGFVSPESILPCIP